MVRVPERRKMLPDHGIYPMNPSYDVRRKDVLVLI